MVHVKAVILLRLIWHAVKLYFILQAGIAVTRRSVTLAISSFPSLRHTGHVFPGYMFLSSCSEQSLKL